LASLLDCLPEPALFITTDRRIVAANTAFREWLSEGGREYGMLCHEVSHGLDVPCDLAGEDCPLERCADEGRPIGAHHVHTTPRGDEHQDVVLYPIQGENGVEGFVEVLKTSQIASAEPHAERLVGRSRAFNRVLELVHRVASSDTTVLLVGESGTGKEVIARAIHESSRRSAGRFVPVDCSGITETLFESELFGHEKGAFTGAYSRKTGLVEEADGGTLFLDEVGEIPLSLQVKLLRMIESGCFRRVGNPRCLPSNFRLVCATHRDLESRIEAGLFRQDLYFRISAFPIRLPPLRERPEDLELLLQSLLARFGAEQCRVDDSAWNVLKAYPFPGNVRELANVIERAVLLCDDDTISAEHLPRMDPEVGVTGSLLRAPREIITLEEAEERYLRWAVASFPGCNRELARHLGITERTLYRRLRQLRDAGPASFSDA
jgi:DNA-binding NtrC family response regulator